MAEFVVKTRDLTKYYNGNVAVDHLNLRVQDGEVFGILGPNGSGKTTTILMLLGLTDPTEGEARVLGFDPLRQPLSVKRHVGYLPDQVGFYDELTAWENLAYIAKLNGIPRREYQQRIAASLERMGLLDVAHKPVGTFSRGMKQRLGVAELLLKQPRLIILDEPTQGLDPAGALEFLEIIRDLKKEGISVILASHLLHQVQAVCDRVGLFYKGQMVLEGTVRELAHQVLGGGYHIRLQAAGDVNALTQALQNLAGVVQVDRVNRDTYEILATDDIRPEVAKAIVQADGKLLSLSLDEPNLEEIYARYFKEVKHERASDAA